MNYHWNILKVGLDKYELYRDGELLFVRTARQIQMDARFRPDYTELMRELDESGEASREFGRGAICQFWPAKLDKRDLRMTLL